jgi:hypothetical protein
LIAFPKIDLGCPSDTDTPNVKNEAITTVNSSWRALGLLDNPSEGVRLLGKETIQIETITTTTWTNLPQSTATRNRGAVNNTAGAVSAVWAHSWGLVCRGTVKRATKPANAKKPKRNTKYKKYDLGKLASQPKEEMTPSALP